MHTLKLIPREAGDIYDKVVVRCGNAEPSDAIVNGRAVLEMEGSGLRRISMAPHARYIHTHMPHRPSLPIPSLYCS